MEPNLTYLYDNERLEMLKYIPKSAKKILEVGCGTGKFAALLKRRIQCEVWAIEQDNIATQIAIEQVDKIFNESVDNVNKYLGDNKFDVIVFLDVLEHLAYPDKTLVKLKHYLKPDGKIVASIPNIRFVSALKEYVLYGEWNYAESGVLDKTHLRFFTYKSIIKFFVNLGFTIEKIEGINIRNPFKLRLINLLFFNRFWDCKYLQFACVLKLNSNDKDV